LEGELATLRTALEEQQRQRAENERRVEELQDALNAARAESAEVRSQAEEAASAQQARIAALEEQQSLRADSEQRVEELQRALDSARAESAQACSQAEEAARVQHARIAVLEAELVVIRAAAPAHTNGRNGSEVFDMDEAKRRIEQLSKDVRQAREESAGLRSTLTSLGIRFY